MRSLRALPAPSADVAGALQREPRALTRAELVALSSPRRVRTALEQGSIVRLLPNAYVAAEHQDSFEARADAALAWAGEGAMLAGASALHAWTVIADPPERIDLVVPHGGKHRSPAWLRVRQPSYPIRAATANGFAVAPVAYAVAQGYADLSTDQRTEAVFGSIARRMTTAAHLRQALVDMPRIRARRSLTSRIEAAERGAESWLEERSLREVFTGTEFDGLVRQHRMHREGRRYRLDMYDPFTRTAFELDSEAWHSGDEQRIRDIRRDADLAAMGILTVRFASRDLLRRPDWCRQVARDVLTARRAR